MYYSEFRNKIYSFLACFHTSSKFHKFLIEIRFEPKKIICKIYGESFKILIKFENFSLLFWAYWYKVHAYFMLHSAQWAFLCTPLIIVNKWHSLSFPLFVINEGLEMPIILNKCSTAGFWDLKKTNCSKLATQNEYLACLFKVHQFEPYHWCTIGVGLSIGAPMYRDIHQIQIDTPVYEWRYMMLHFS